MELNAVRYRMFSFGVLIHLQNRIILYLLVPDSWFALLVSKIGTRCDQRQVYLFLKLNVADSLLYIVDLQYVDNCSGTYTIGSADESQITNPWHVGMGESLST